MGVIRRLPTCPTTVIPEKSGIQGRRGGATHSPSKTDISPYPIGRLPPIIAP